MNEEVKQHNAIGNVRRELMIIHETAFNRVKSESVRTIIFNMFMDLEYELFDRQVTM